MRRLALVCVLAAFLAALPPPALGASSVSFRVEMTDRGFVVAGEPGLNPVLFVAPGAHVHVTVRNNGSSPQNFHVGAPVNASTPFAQRPGEAATLDFDVPADLVGDVPYFSDADTTHLAGVFRVGDVPPVVRILAPDADGATSPPDVTVQVGVQRFTLDPYPFSLTNQPGRGHVLYVVDGANASGPTDRTTVTLPRLALGTHLVRVLLVEHDGSPVVPAASADRVVRVVAPTPTAPSANATTTTTPQPGGSGIPGAPLALVLAGALAAALVTSSACRRRR